MSYRARKRAWQLLERSLPPIVLQEARRRREIMVKSTAVPGRRYQVSGFIEGSRNHWIVVFQEVVPGHLGLISRF